MVRVLLIFQTVMFQVRVTILIILEKEKNEYKEGTVTDV